MTSVTLDELNENILSLQKELQELKEIVHLSNRYELAQVAREARAGKGNWRTLDSI